MPQIPFKLPENSALFSPWDHRLSPKIYMEKVFGCLCHQVDDERPYDSNKVLAYLDSSGAKLIESTIWKGTDAAKAEKENEPFFLTEPTFYYLYLYKDALIVIDCRRGEFLIETYATTQERAIAVHAEFEPFLAPPKGEASVSILLNGAHGMTTKSVDFSPPVIEDLALNYGSAFPAVDKQIQAKLNENRASLMMFHGAAGCGKTTYIKWLTSRIDREFIFIPIAMAGELASPAFLQLLLNHERAILVLEDAEQALQSRETDVYNSSTISTLLNLSDGILGTLLNITIIATYNADRQSIDKALLRKGRLSFDYTFNKLSVEDAKRLAVHLKKDPNVIVGPTSLADIYNAKDDTGYVAPVAKTMGFGAVLG